jgi:hypothetical protein
MNNSDINKLYDELLAVFIEYQYKIDYPFSYMSDNKQLDGLNQYRNDPAFHYKVQRIMQVVMDIVKKYIS